MRGVMTTACEVAGASCIGFAFGWLPGMVVLGLSLIGAGVIEGRRQ